MQAVWNWFAWLHQQTGINLSIFYDPFDRERFGKGFLTTVELAVACIALSLVIGVFGAWLQGSKLKLPRRIVYWYIQFFRNTPPLVQLYFFYFGIGALLRLPGPNGIARPVVSNIAWAIISLSFYAGAFNVEIFRAGIEAVPRATIEAAEALGFSRLAAYRHVVLPLAFRISLPALNNNLVNLVKATTLAYAISVPELLWVSNQIWSDELNVTAMMNVLLIVYVGLVGILVFVMHRWEYAMRVPGFGAVAAPRP
ncbi:MAG TPA: amino acid ABC transporter permease [Stellaceae bacterium]|nr:amino acid ABC transporter permease [Stellaceae bacterium]